MDRHLQKKHIAIIAAISGIAIVCFILVITFVPIGPGLPPPDIRKDWFIPPRSNTTDLNDTTLYPLTVEQTNCFPFISVPNGLCSHVEYGISTTEARLMADSLYFQKRNDFLQAHCELCNFLSSHGSTEPVLLHMKTPAGDEYDLSLTSYSTNTFQGYFFVVERPFISSSEDYFILYYGYLDDDSRRYSNEMLNTLIAQAGLDRTREGSVGRLDCERCY